MPQLRPTLILCDVQGKEVARQTVETNRYGSCAAQFVLPEQGRNGRFSLRADSLSGSCSFRVEAYKRPTFTVDFQPVTQTYAAGDTVTVQGALTSFSGVKMARTRVHIQVQSECATWLGRYGAADRRSRQVLDEDVFTNDQGQFTVSVPLDTLAEAGRYRRWYAAYRVEARAVSSSGETQEGSTTLRTGSHRLTVDWTEEGSGSSSGMLWVKERPQKIRFIARNLQGEPVPSLVTVSVQAMEDEISENSWICIEQITSSTACVQNTSSIACGQITSSTACREDPAGLPYKLSSRGDYPLYSTMLALMMRIFSRGRSALLVRAISIFSTVSMPSMTSPNTV
jgi:hypothetical protein